jgi:hypothetical protein
VRSPGQPLPVFEKCSIATLSALFVPFLALCPNNMTFSVDAASPFFLQISDILPFRHQLLLTILLNPRIAILSLDNPIWDKTRHLLHLRIRESAPDQSLDRECDAFRYLQGKSTVGISNQPAAVDRYGDMRRCCSVTFAILVDDGCASMEIRPHGSS